MKVDERALQDVHTVGGGETPPRVGLTSNTLPKAQSTVSAESSQTGVSTRNAHIAVKPKAQKEEDDVIIVTGEIQKFEKGQLVRVVKGEFEGFMGIVARHKGQQRVGIVVDNLLTVLTAYVPSAYCEVVEDKQK